MSVLKLAVRRSVIEARRQQGGIVYVASSIPSMRDWLAAAFAQGTRESWPAARAIRDRHEDQLAKSTAP